MSFWNQPTPSWEEPLAAWLHEMGVGCDWEPNSPMDHGLGFHHTGDHDADAKRLRSILQEGEQVAQPAEPDIDRDSAEYDHFLDSRL